ncbi:MAG TPA: PhnA domain-containing protein [Saprospiraceae bacterium]|nr:PhnA domain-containing protein [Saprospiraceae bacterium]
MSIQSDLQSRSGGNCELCGSAEETTAFEVKPAQNQGSDGYALLCANCQYQLEHPDEMYSDHWRCLNDSMWSEVPVVKVLAWRALYRLRGEGWPQDLLDMMYLDEATLEWAKARAEIFTEDQIVHKDANGAVLEAGDTVTLIQDLKVKGAGLTAKRGTAVRRISLDPNNAEYIEGKVDGQHVVILTQFVKKANK